MTENYKLRKAILSAFYNILQQNFGILLILWCSFMLWWNFVWTCWDQKQAFKIVTQKILIQRFPDQESRFPSRHTKVWKTWNTIWKTIHQKYIAYISWCLKVKGFVLNANNAKRWSLRQVRCTSSVIGVHMAYICLQRQSIKYKHNWLFKRCISK
jgi:hypothetical protein